MCVHCWHEYGSPSDLPEGADAALALIREVYAHPEGGTGGPLHVQLDDWNLELSWEPWDGGRDPYPPELMETCERLCELMRPWTEDERAAVLAVHHGYLDRSSAIGMEPKTEEGDR